MEPCGLASPRRCAFFRPSAVRTLFFFTALAIVLPNAWATPAATTTTLAVTSSGSPATSVTSGAIVTLTATVISGSSPVNPGQVKFCDASTKYCEDSALLATAQLTPAGIATYKFRPGPGSHKYQAVFVGTTSYAKSSSVASDLTVTLVKYPTITAITSAGSIGNYTLTATVAGLGSSSLAPTGSVSFLDTTNNNSPFGTVSLGAATLTQGFVTGSTPNLSAGPTSGIASGDFNGDGILDLVGPVRLSNSLALMFGNSDGTFSTPDFINPGLGGSFAIGDFNGDGILDLVIVNPGVCNTSTGCSGGSVNVLLGNGDGTFTTKVSPGIGIDNQWIALADFNGDGILDIAMSNCASQCTPNDIGVIVALGNGDGTFTSTKSTIIAGRTVNLAQVTVGDFNGDGIPDLISGSFLDGTDLVLLGNGDGTFTEKTTVSFPGSDWSWASSVTVGDFNGDGIVDFAAIGEKYNGAWGVLVFLGNGDGTFAVKSNIFVGTNLNLNSMAVGDFNNDGISDLVIADSSSNVVTVLQGKGNGSFSLSTINVPNQPSSVVVGDFNGDGWQDLALNTGGDDTLTILLKQIAEVATATLNNVSVSGTEIHQVEASYPGDASHLSSVSSTVPLLAEKLATALSLSSSANSFGAGTTITLTATLSPSSLGTYITDGETVTFYFKDASIGTGTLSGGVATLNTNLLPAGTDSVTVSYPGDANFSSTTSSPLALSVAQVATTLQLTTSLLAYPPSGYQLVLTANLSSSFSGPFSYDGGTVIFYNGGKKIGAATLSSSTATLTINPLPAGTYTLQASYPGDINFVASQSPASTLVATSLQLNVSTSSSVFGGPVTLAATLTPSSSGSAATDGETITFYSGPFSIGTATLASGVATLNTTSLPVGSYLLTASYAGDPNFLGALSNSLPETVRTVSGAIQTYVVTTTADDAGVAANCTGAGTPNCSLRDALAAATTDGAGNITFATPLFATSQTIVLSNNALSVSSNTAITGPSGGVTVSGSLGGFDPLFSINDGTVNVSISNLTISGNTAYGARGAGLYNGGQLTFSNSSVSGNTAVNLFPGGFSYGAGIYNAGTMTLTNSRVSGNGMNGRESGGGGGAFNGGTLTLINTSVSSNDVSCGGTCPNFGGGIANIGTLILMGSSVSGNTARLNGSGSGISNTGILVATNSNVTANDSDGNPQPNQFIEDDCDAPLYSYYHSNACPLNGVNGNTTGPPQPTQPAAAAPQFSPSGGTAAGSLTETITDTTPGAIIFYTTNETPVWTRYIMPIKVTNTDTLQAIAVASGYSESLIATQTYTFPSATAQPLISPPSGTYTSAQSVTITDTNPSAVIYYTTDGTTPNRSSARFSGTPITVSSSQTIKALAVAPGYATSPEGVAIYNIIPPYAATPTFSLPPGSYQTAQTVSLSDATPGAKIYYTADHSVPTTSSTLYTGGSIAINITTQLKAIAVAPGYSTSPIAVGDYNIAAAQPVISPPTGRYSGPQTVTITSTIPGATIYYTTDGTTPNWHSPVFNPASPIVVTSSQTIKALAWAPGYTTSPEGVSILTITP